MSNESPSLDDLYGVGAEAADDFGGTMDEIWERIRKLMPEPAGFGDESADYDDAARKVFEAEMTKMWDSYRDMCRRHEHALDQTERLTAERDEAVKTMTSYYDRIQKLEASLRLANLDMQA
jgi:hypothetical protein